MPPIRFLFGACTVVALALVRVDAAAPAARPNIVVILADDLGFSDVGCYGGEIATPNIDRLAAGGLRFTEFYNTSRCCPTRASLLTGLYPHQTGLGHMVTDKGLPGYRGQLQENTATLAEVLRSAGYSTAMVGKWHITANVQGPDHLAYLNNHKIKDTFGDVSSYPINRGFERYYGVIWGVVNYFDPFSLVEGDQPVRSVPKDYYITDALTDKALTYLDEAAAAKKPFFLYAAYTAPHWPLHAKPADLAKYRDTYKQGWDAIRAARYERQKKLGLFDPRTAPLSPRFDADKQHWETNPDAEHEASIMTAHAAMVDCLDQNIGRLVRKIEQLGQLDNTLILFLSDNGASPERINVGGYDRTTETRDGRHVMYPPELRAKKIAPGPETTYAAIGRTWANVANTPFRMWKAFGYEGGVCTPFIAHWPAGIREHGSFRAQPSHVIDIMATVVDVAGAKYPAERKGRKIAPAEGRSLLPTFANTPAEPRFIGFEHEGFRVARQGDWKLVGPPDQPWELYNIAQDRTEQKNVAAENPERVRELSAAWEAWARRTQVYPAPPAGQRKKI